MNWLRCIAPRARERGASPSDDGDGHARAGYLGISDAEMVELTVVDLRVQMVLGCLGTEAPAFSQGALQEFRERLIAADLDRRLLERTVDVAKRSQAFDYRKLPKTLRVAIDSSPLEGAGRVEDTFNLLAHAARMW